MPTGETDAVVVRPMRLAEEVTRAPGFSAWSAEGDGAACGPIRLALSVRYRSMVELVLRPECRATRMAMAIMMTIGKNRSRLLHMVGSTESFWAASAMLTKTRPIDNNLAYRFILMPVFAPRVEYGCSTTLPGSTVF